MLMMIIMFAIVFMVPYFLIITTMEKWERPGTLTLGDESKVPGLMFRSATLGALRVAEVRRQDARRLELVRLHPPRPLDRAIRLDGHGLDADATLRLLGLAGDPSGQTRLRLGLDERGRVRDEHIAPPDLVHLLHVTRLLLHVELLLDGAELAVELVVEELITHAVCSAALLKDAARHVAGAAVGLHDEVLVELLDVDLLGLAEHWGERVSSARTGAGVAIGTSHSVLQLLC